MAEGMEDILRRHWNVPKDQVEEGLGLHGEDFIPLIGIGLHLHHISKVRLKQQKLTGVQVAGLGAYAVYQAGSLIALPYAIYYLSN